MALGQVSITGPIVSVHGDRVIAQREPFPWLETGPKVRELAALESPHLSPGTFYPLHYWSTPFGGCLRPQTPEFSLQTINLLTSSLPCEK